MKRRLFLQSPFLAAPLSLQAQPVDRPKKGFKVEAGKDRFDQTHTNAQRGTFATKLSGKDTDGDLFIYETKRIEKGGPALHLHQEQDEWFHILEGEYILKAGEALFRCKAGDCVFVPRKVAHAFAKVSEGPGTLMIMFQPAGKMEDFFIDRRKKGAFANQQEEQTFWRAYGMELLGPPLPVE
jgi:mannose-6-phosphate isomerase-like protein (cupin superfamily)